MDDQKKPQSAPDTISMDEALDSSSPSDNSETSSAATAEPFGGVSHNLEHQEYKPIHSIGDIGENAVRAASNFGAGVLQAPYSIGHALLDPIQTGKEVWAGMHDPANIDPTGTVQMAKQIASGRGAELAGNMVGGAAMGEMGGAMARVPSLNLGERFAGYKSPVIPNALQSASKAAEAIRPPGGILPDFEQNLATNLPKIRGFAQETGNPLHSQWETAEAARQLANKGLTHYKSNFLDPYANEQISMRTVPEYQGAVSGEGRMTTLGQLEKRISDINDMQRAAERAAKTTGAQMSAEQALGLENEAAKLRDILYREIGRRTGVDPSLIRDLRQSYGQQFNIADTIDAARRARLGQTGASAEMGGSVPFSKTGIIEKAMQGIRGGQDYIANARLRKALQAFEPQRTEYPMAKTIGNAGSRAPQR